MSPTRKPKPPDKGAPPDHKPSRKVALAEVMRSLQDLVSNELSVEPTPQSGDTAVPKKRRRTDQKQPSVRADNRPAALNDAQEIESITLESLPASAAETLAAPEPLTSTKKDKRSGTSLISAPAGGLQQELPYLDPLAPPPPENPPESAALAPPVDTPETALSLSEENWDDIPVLEEAVDLAEEIDTDAPGHDAPSPPAAALPPAAAARRLAIQVAARLNVELRKSGQTGLNSTVITQLAKMLEDALAKNAANMENTTAKDGGSAENAGAAFPPTAMEGGSAGNAGAVFRPTARDGGSAESAGATFRPSSKKR